MKKKETKIMKTKLALMALTASILALGGIAHAEILVSNPHSFETAEGTKVGMAGMTFENTGTEAEKLVGASSPVCDHVEIHEMKMEDDVMKMRKVEDGLEIPASGKLVLESGSYHLMLIDLKEPLKAGSTVGVDVEFASGAKQHVDVPVSARVEKQGHDMMNHENMGHEGME